MPTLVNVTKATSGSVTIPSTTAGNCIIVATGSSSGTVSGITLGGSSANFAQSVGEAAGGGYDTEIWADPNCGGGQTAIVVSGITVIGITVYEFSGIVTSSPVDKTTTGAGDGSSYSSGTTATTSQGNEVIVGAATSGNGLTPEGSPWTDESPSGGEFGTGYQIVSSASTFTYAGSSSGGPGGYWGAVVATFKAITVPLVIPRQRRQAVMTASLY